MDRIIESIRMLDDDDPVEKKRHMAYTLGILKFMENWVSRGGNVWGFVFQQK